MSASPSVFEKEVRIRFSHCDPAGMVYYPRYVTLVQWLVEDWFNEGLQIDFAGYIGRSRLGLPVVTMRFDFMEPARHGDLLNMRLSVLRVGRRSITIAIEGIVDGRPRLRAEQVLVTTSLDTGTAVEIPEDLRAVLQRFATTDNG